ncbi:hypothetical protein BN2476_1230002 [Paraburkholderia piptadeniae]|uniref:Uncharacterized protein n=1 Tax=Paraburkholderia piptadeniae TaxID=1701573 RepID=A0A1N7SVN7_9BURK|nr:hypothetical protein BN2476_1230002 [Paraburkholderia piptadeniae]
MHIVSDSANTRQSFGNRSTTQHACNRVSMPCLFSCCGSRTLAAAPHHTGIRAALCLLDMTLMRNLHWTAQCHSGDYPALARWHALYRQHVSQCTLRQLLRFAIELQGKPEYSASG